MNDGGPSTTAARIGDPRALREGDDPGNRGTVSGPSKREGHALKCEVALDVKPIDGDSDRLVRVLSNLLSNALNFSPGGRQISVRAAHDQHTVRFSVKDSGVGIPESNLPDVFDRFWQADRVARTGAGLGLSICKGIVQAHGGHIWIASKVDRGTTFYFTVPMAER
jgi:signal transduction histidine kinase